jgi:hypothetical protein
MRSFRYWPARSSLVIPYLTTPWRGIVRLVVLSAVFSAVASLISGELEERPAYILVDSVASRCGSCDY